MNIKAQGLLNAAKWIEEEYGTDGLRDVVRACSPEVRDRYTSAIAINWHPLSEFVEFLSVADKVLGRGDGRIAEEIGAAGARSNTKGTLLRLAFFLARPEFLMKRITQLWRQFNDQGSMELLHLDEYSSTIEVKGIAKPQWLFCCTLTGWARQVAIAFGGVNPLVRHTECRARGGPRCVWNLRWTGVSTSEMAHSVAPPSSSETADPSSSSRVAEAPPAISEARIPTSEPRPSSRKRS